jgi:hypothetical protein
MDLFPTHVSRECGKPGEATLRELHLYHGSRCNRACAFCTVDGAPEGWHRSFTPEILDAALRWVAADGNLKVYGGEPTLDLESLLSAAAYLRRGGFTGWLTVFSNGVLAERVVRLLESDERSEVVLNRSILYGEGAEPLPPRARNLLERYASAHPGRLFASHADLVPVGRGAGLPGAEGGFGGRCPRCHPVLTTRGILLACPFAVDQDLDGHRHGDLTLSGTEAVERHAAFLEWIDTVLEPAAGRAGLHPCRLCTAAQPLPGG